MRWLDGIHQLNEQEPGQTQELVRDREVWLHGHGVAKVRHDLTFENNNSISKTYTVKIRKQ